MRLRSALIVLALLFAGSSVSEDCSNFNGEMGCSGGQVTTNPMDWA